MNNRNWVKNIVCYDLNAFIFLTRFIKIELIVNEKVRYWNGFE